MEELQKWLTQLSDENLTRFERVKAGVQARKIIADKIKQLRMNPKKINGASQQGQPNPA